MGRVFSETLGGFDMPGVGLEKKVGAWIIFIMLQLITNIVVLNTLIAILGDSYDNVMNEQNRYDMKMKMELLQELNGLMMTKARRKLRKKFIIIVRYFEKDQSSVQWEGKIKMITRQIKTQGDEIIAKIKSVDETTKNKFEKIDKDVAGIAANKEEYKKKHRETKDEMKVARKLSDQRALSGLSM